MAIIKCPVCGLETDSSFGVVCPVCGYTLEQSCNEYFEQNTADKKEAVYYDILEGRDEFTFSNGLEHGSIGKCTDKYGAFDYLVENNLLYISRNAGTVIYTIADGFLLNHNGKYTGQIPDDVLFNASCVKKDIGGRKSTITFSRNGKFTQNSPGFIAGGTYVRRKNLIAIQYYNSENPMCYLIYNHSLYFASSVSKERVSEVKDLITNFAQHLDCSQYIQNISNFSTTHHTATTVAFDKTTVNLLKGLCLVAAIIIALFVVQSCNRQEPSYSPITNTNTNVNSNTSTHSSVIHKCEECDKIGTYRYESFTGKTEYYCAEHYRELKNLLEQLGIE